jgi:hypothetical protein
MNLIKGAHENKRGILRRYNPLIADPLNSNSIIDVEPNNGSFTWNKRWRSKAFLMERLNKPLLSEDWLENESNVKSFMLEEALSNH